MFVFSNLFKHTNVLYIDTDSHNSENLMNNMALI